MSLREYARKRRFAETPEPDESDAPRRKRKQPMFVVHLHNARARHYDLRLEVDGALKSWAVPKGPSLRVGEKRLAVQVEDHPLAYAGFEGEIPAGNYGAGHVLVFDRGTWRGDGDTLAALAAGKLDFELQGGKLQGGWKLVRTGMRRGAGSGNAGKPQWLLIKRDDAHARDVDADDLVDAEPSAATSAKVRDGKRIAGKSKPPSPRAPRKRKLNDGAWKKRALALPDADGGAMPVGFQPQLASLRQQAPPGEAWLHEVKWDGYRLLVDLVDGRARLRSRNDLDWTARLRSIAAAIEALPVSDACIDGELVALGNRGASDFALLQQRLQAQDDAGLHFIAFDLPGLAGVDLTDAPLLARKTLLHALLGKADAGVLRYSDHLIGHGPDAFAASAKQGLEGIISKRVDAPYLEGRSQTWVKAKHADSDEFLIIGYSQPQGARTGFGALLLATRDAAGKLRYAGRVGTGFEDAALRKLHARMQPLRRQAPTLALPAHLPHDKRDRGDIMWLQPRLVAEVAHRGFGRHGLLRQASFLRLRIDKNVQDIGMDKQASKRFARKAGKSAKGEQSQNVHGVVITHPERVVFAGAGISKGEVADYYAAVAKWLLPELAKRPLSLLRCPDGVGGECFFQKHHAASLGARVHAVALAQKSGHEDYLYLRDARGLLALVQMNAIELHPWGARVDKPEHPDTLVFDLDPGPGVAWKTVIAAAREMRARLADAGLESFVRLSGGKGLHVVAPIRRGPSWDEVRDFCSAFAETMALHKPLLYVATMSKARREGRIFIDWLRNARGATSVCNWSLRARDGATVAMPIRWQELGRMPGPDAFDLHRARRRAAALKQDPWAGFRATRQSLPR